MILLRWIPIDRRAYPPPRRRMERFPLERATILALLDDETLYVPSAAAEVGYPKGSAEYIRARRAFSYFANEHGMAEAFDNTDKEPGEAAGWFGSSWKWALGPRMHRVADLMDKLRRLQQAQPGMRFFLDDETILSEDELRNRGLEVPNPAEEPLLVTAVAEEDLGEPTEAPAPRRSWTRRKLLGLSAISLCLLACGWLGLTMLQSQQLEAQLFEAGRCLTSTIEYLGRGD